jgi:putative ABC transport system substrate-binding protein
VRRRKFITLLGGAAAWPIAARAQQPRIPVIGFLHQGPPDPSTMTNAFLQGLKEMGFIEGRNAKIEHRWANGVHDVLPTIAADLVKRRVSVIAANFYPAARAAKGKTATIPIIFLSGSDPVEAGLVSSLDRPEGNITGVAFKFTLSGANSLQLLKELMPKATAIAVLMNPKSPDAELGLQDVQSAARALDQQLIVLGASDDRGIAKTFAKLAESRVGPLLVLADGFLIGQQTQLIALATRYAVPTMYPLRQFVTAGGLISYGLNLSDAFRRTGIYVGRILKGEKPIDLPVVQSTKVELVINLKIAKALGLEIPPTLLARADEVID